MIAFFGFHRPRPSLSGDRAPVSLRARTDAAPRLLLAGSAYFSCRANLSAVQDDLFFTTPKVAPHVLEGALVDAVCLCRITIRASTPVCACFGKGRPVARWVSAAPSRSSPGMADKRGYKATRKIEATVGISEGGAKGNAAAEAACDTAKGELQTVTLHDKKPRMA